MLGLCPSLARARKDGDHARPVSRTQVKLGLHASIHTKASSAPAAIILGQRTRGPPLPWRVEGRPHHDTSAGSAAAIGRFLASCRCLINEYSAGITTSVSTVDDTMPPTIGAAMRRMTSEPVPLLHMKIGRADAPSAGKGKVKT